MAVRTLRLIETLVDLEDLDLADLPASESSDTLSLSIGVPKSPERMERRCMGRDLEEELEGEEIWSTPKLPSGPPYPGFSPYPVGSFEVRTSCFSSSSSPVASAPALPQHRDQQWEGKKEKKG